MAYMEEMMRSLGERFGVLAESNTTQLTIIARNTDIAVGDLFLLPSQRGADRFYIFRTTQYANILNRLNEMSEVARNKLTMPDSYLAEDLSDEKLIELKGMVLGYAEWKERGEKWEFHRPRRLPQHLSDVFHVDPKRAEIGTAICALMESQLGKDGLYIGDLLAGEESLPSVPVYLPPFALSHHIGIFGRTGSGKSNLMMVLLRSIFEYNRKVFRGEAKSAPASIFAIDPHDEFRFWHLNAGGADGVHGIVETYSAEEKRDLVEPFYYISAKNMDGQNLERRVFLSRADITPEDLISISEFTEQQIAFANTYYALHGENWIGRLLMGDTVLNTGREQSGDYLPGTIAAVQRRVGFLRFGYTRIVNRFDPEVGLPYDSLLPDIICAIERGRVIIVDTTLMNETEQFLLTTVVARVLFSLRKALRSAESADTLPKEIRQALGNDDEQGQIGMRTLADKLIKRLKTDELPYFANGKPKSSELLPFVNIVIEEAPSVLNPQRMKFGSIFRDISRQGRKFGIGLTVISQQVSEIDQGVLTQINTELIMGLGNETERREAIRNASSDLGGFERELQVMSKGQVLVTSSYKDIPLPVFVPLYELD
jgi:uncharacterized protein